MKAIVENKNCNDQEYISKIIGLCDRSCNKYYSKNKTLFAEGTQAEGVLCIRSGKAKLLKTGSNKKEIILRFVSEGDIIGVKSVINNEKHTVSAEALEELIACFIPKDDFLALLEKTPDLAKYLISCLGKSLLEAENRNISMVHKTEPQRLAEALIYLSGKFHSDEIKLLKNDIVGFTSLKRNYLNHYLKTFRESKLIALNSERIKILNFNGLREMANIPA